MTSHLTTLNTLTDSELILPKENIGDCVTFGQPAYNDIMHFLTMEGRCLDDADLTGWLSYLAEDILYSVPIRQTVHRSGGSGFDFKSFWIYDRKPEITFKMERVILGDSGWSEDPASRSRRFITSVVVYKTTNENEFFVQSNILVKRGRGSASQREMETLSGRRDDIIRRKGDSWEIARRQVLLDHTVLGTQNFAIYL
jgi:3-phenylpropionate/cinnamic acid dioxygenase small subunit